VKYQSGAAFRRALEDRLVKQSLDSGSPLVRLRKMVAFERFLARLVADRPDAWLLKGGLALQWRLGDRARTTKDLDMLLIVSAEDAHVTLVRAGLLDLGDWFRYLVQQPTRAEARDAGGLRFLVRSLLDGRPFETFHLDIGWGDPVIEPAEKLTAPSLLGFADIDPTVVPCYPVTQHIAEKLHAYTRPHLSGESSRVKDLVDILLIARMRAMDAAILLKALQATFEVRKTHPLPSMLPDPPAIWAAPFRRLAGEVGLEDDSLAGGAELAHRFLDPVLQGHASGAWDPHGWQWLD
jgi:hypothetical protein